MDSPETDKTKSSSSSTSPGTVPIQESPIFSYISNLSPIKPVKGAPVAPGFLGLNSPPMVFASPHFNLSRERSFPKRLQYNQSSSIELYNGDDQVEKSATDADISGNQVISRSISYTEERDNKCSMQGQAGSPSGCVDQYFADGVEVEGGETPHSSNLCLKQSDIMSRDDNQPNDRKDAENIVAAEEGCLEKSLLDEIKTDSIETKHQGDEIPSIVQKKCEHSVAQHAGSHNENKLDSTFHFEPESCQIKDCSEMVTRENVENLMLLGPKASQNHLTTRRRCLQFEEVQRQNNLVNRLGSWNPLASSKSHSIPADVEVPESSCMEVPELSTLNPPIITAMSPVQRGFSNLITSKPSGIGLHLNTVANGGTSKKSAGKCHLSIQGKKLVSVMGCSQSETKRNNSGLLDVVEKVSATAEDVNHLAHDSIEASSAISLSPQIVKPLDNVANLKPSESHATPNDKRKSYAETGDTIEELNQLSPKKKRKKASGSSDGGGCKRCNCKKTKCLKLYCDCFAAGVYCAEACSCQGCFNKPEHEDKVLETRHQIESRNPLAFAPKIVQRVTESPANRGEDRTHTTPSSARHKRGCNCKKSMCLKKYCECYQSNVGCSDGCRCEGCKNVYGRKEEFAMTVVGKGYTYGGEGTCDEKLKTVGKGNDGFFQSELSSSHNLTPNTPSSYHSSENGQYPLLLPYGRYSPSPEPDLALLPPYGDSPTSPIISDNNNVGVLDLVCYHHQEDHEENSDIPIQFSPRIGPDTNNHHLNTTTMEWTNVVSREQLCCPRSGIPLTSSLHWRSTPITPMTQFGDAKPGLQMTGSRSSRFYDTLEDDTPEILKDSATPGNAVKISSPNKKRVSPPSSGNSNNHLLHHDLGSRSSSSAVLKSGRKFILQAVPSFPPLTPCVDSNDSTTANKKKTSSDSRDCH